MKAYQDSHDASRVQQAAVLLSRGLTAARGGRVDEAEAFLRSALAIDAGNLPILDALVRALLTQNKNSEACDAMDSFVAGGHALPEDMKLLHAQTLLAAGRPLDAIPTFQGVISMRPENAKAELGLAVSLGEAGRSEEAMEAAHRAIAKGADNPGARYVLGRALFNLDRHREAELQFRHALRQRPDFVDAHANLADLIWMRSGDATAASHELDACLRCKPESVELRALKARLLRAAGFPQKAHAEILVGLHYANDSVGLHRAAAESALLFDHTLALDHAERAVKASPRQLASQRLWAGVLLAAGLPEKAAHIAETLRALNPNDSHAIATLATAWRMLGDLRYQSLYDYGRYVRAVFLETPPGWADLSSFLSDIASVLRDRHVLQAHPVDQTLRGGSQVDIRSEHLRNPVLKAFVQVVDGAIRRYMDELGHGDDVLGVRNTGQYRLNGMWSVRLRPNGHHVNHFHGRGWLSSAFYVELNGDFREHGGQGWLQFGEPSMPTTVPLPAEYFIRPEAGLLVLFPSWMWHGTVPFEGAPHHDRLTIAFDVVPV